MKKKYYGMDYITMATKEKIFENVNNFPEQMIAAHLSNHIWGGKPKK